MHLNSYNCVLCVENVEEDINHLFFCCPFSSTYWLYLNIQCDTSLDFQTMMLRATESFNSVVFREMVIMSMWAIWTHRNSIIFDEGFLSCMKAVTLRVKPRIKDKILIWLSSL
ncbi:hypothetical protein HU200_049379 [Digitaria exilis]|uniref:Reverse transcriptase zinc-binding domain-containing protein n=1 Tax=Digitaria exilis TaxID=1010633 RepID=A0A835E8K8_9POAL|nr:hypothetical protein HU200_049379 [Digitaria exilis]